MSLKKSSAFIVIGALLLLLSVGIVIYLKSSAIVSYVSSTKVYKNIFPAKPIEIEDDVYHRKYSFDPSIHSNSKIVEQIRGTDVDRFYKKLVITQDESKIGASLIKNNNKVSGYGNKIDYDNQLVYLYLYINPDYVDETQILYHLNRDYIGALLSAAELDKSRKDQSYRPNYNLVEDITQTISAENYDTDHYFLTIK